MILFIYRALIQPLSLFFVFTVGLFIKKIRQGLSIRFNKKFQLAKKSEDSKPIWIHCSSGEFEYAKPILRELKKLNYKTLVTFFSPSHHKTILNNPHVDFAHPIPFDIPGPILSYINHFKPQKILFSRTDVWPELVLQAKRKNIPTLLFSRTQKKIGPLNELISKWKCQNLSAISFVSKVDKENSLYLNGKIKSFTSGDTRFDEVIHRKNLNKKVELIEPSGFTIVLGSVWPEDIENLFNRSFIDFVETKGVQLIICPHEMNPNFLTNIKDRLNNKVELYSTLSKPWIGNSHLIVDTYGELFEIYGLASLSFIGGSFKKQVHSVMEPLAHGCPVVVGPYNKNNREAQEFKIKFIGRNIPIVKEIKNSDDMINHIKAIINCDVDIKQCITEHTLAKSGASAEIIKWIQT